PGVPVIPTPPRCSRYPGAPRCVPPPRHCPCVCPGRAAACSALNQELRKKGHGADPRSRRSLLRQLQALIKETSTKPAQTGTCVLILFLSLGLILLPSSSPFRRGGSRDGLGPTGVISRNILTRREPGAAAES
ncbi:CR3L4 protein, partial [Cercotrichas coryphoeus]|nr:CR3L4 protein [Cercotrichas coryphoeus]